ncbi:hypothetical protein [Nitrosococcus watsonii]|uniref:Uncharacterized protein n=1 Tax=Nitrosococcus watsoni (strain C-113) TaxID=105559 RepID=D8K5U3_NITWC|nr:hypothetical protein [Nitrosococcus watsonii]ADJ28270.1 conserved hypothetical protein [Nitrosococcus watsonii C-113]
MNHKKTIVALFATVGLIGLITEIRAEVVTGSEKNVSFEAANITGSGRRVNIHRVPITDVFTGKTDYYDLVLEYKPKGRKDQWETPGDFKFRIAEWRKFQFPNIPVTQIVPGRYVDQTKRCIYNLEGPTLIQDRWLYTLKGEGNSFSAQIISGPAVGHPDIGEREIAAFLPSTYVWGMVITEIYSYCGAIWNSWEHGNIVGLRRNGNNLSIGLFSDGEDDFTTPLASDSLTLIEDE